MSNIQRLGSSQLTDKILINLRQQMKEQDRLFEQISSNKKIIRPSDDPIATSKSIDFRNQLNRNQEYENVVNSADVWTNMTSAALDDSISTWNRFNEIAIAASDGSKNAADRLGMAEEIEQLLQHLIQIGNTSHAGRYLFSGSKTQTPPFRFESDANTGKIQGVYYEGDSFVRQVKTKDSGTLSFSISGSNAGSPDKRGSFIDSNEDIDAFKSMIQLRDKLLNNDIMGISGAGGIIDQVEQVAASLSSAQVRLGGAQEVLELDRNRLVEQNADLEQFLSEIEDADVAKLIMELNNVQNVYEAALASGGRIMQLSLLNFI